MTNKHTPAPWIIDNQNITTSDYMIIANLPRQIHNRGSIAGENEALEKVANARLIAAAPELLEVLELAFEIITDDYTLDSLEEGYWPSLKPDIKKIQSVIKKAKGE